MVTDDSQSNVRERRYRREQVIMALPRNTFSQFFDFVRERGVAGFAVGFILGGAVGKLVDALTNDLIDPALGLFVGPVKNIENFAVGAFKIGDFLSALINFLMLCFVMFLMFRVLRLEQLDKKK